MKSHKPFLCNFIDAIENTSRVKYQDPKHFLSELGVSFSNNVSKPILILANKYDASTFQLSGILISMGIDYVRLNAEDFASNLKLRYRAEKNSGEYIIDGVNLHAKDIPLVLMRNFETTFIDGNGSEFVRAFSIQQWEHAFQIMRYSLNCAWIPGTPESISKANNRAVQLAKAKEIGFDVPDTLITNDPREARAFYREHHAQIVMKVLHHHGIQVGKKMYSIYTYEVRSMDLRKFDDMIHAPCILQEKVDRSHEIRVTVVGDKAFAVTLDLTSKSDLVDWHRMAISKIPKKEFALGNTLTGKCVKLVRSLGLVYGAIDLLVDKRGRTFFLEVNPTGDWHWLGDEINLKITLALAELIKNMIDGKVCSHLDSYS